MKLLRNEVSFGHEVKFAQYAAAYFIREAYIIRVSGYHGVRYIIRFQRERISLKKRLAFASRFFLVTR